MTQAGAPSDAMRTHVGVDARAPKAPPLRIAFLADQFPVISETFVATLGADLVAAGQDLRILVREATVPDAPMHDLVARSGLARLVARPVFSGRLPAWRAIALARDYPDRAVHLAGLWALDRITPRHTLAVSRMMAAEAPFDVVHCQFATLGLVAMRHRRYGTLRTRALVVHLRGYDITRFVEEQGRNVYDRLFRTADLLIANCAFFRDRAIALGCPPHKVIVIGSPIDTERFAPPAARTVPKGRPVRLVAVGRLVEKKGFADAVEAVALLAAGGRDVRLDILGDGECRADLEAQVARASLDDRVTLHGHVTQAQVIAALHEADIALAPSVTASTGDADAAVNTAKEAMATGLPVIATRHGGIPELVIPGENGDLVPERDPVALAASIARLMDDPSSWRRFGQVGRAMVVTEYERSRILEKTLEAYRMALARVGGGSHD